MMAITPDEAASLLDAELRKYPWFLSVGIGNAEDGRPILFVYTRTARHRELAPLAAGWKGYEVVVRAVGSIRPVYARIK